MGCGGIKTASRMSQKRSEIGTGTRVEVASPGEFDDTNFGAQLQTSLAEHPGTEGAPCSPVISEPTPSYLSLGSILPLQLGRK